jgi:hypothetical protein
MEIHAELAISQLGAQFARSELAPERWALLVRSRWRASNRQMPTAQYGHDSEPEA